ncbi:anti-anti-sigma factor [Krasilnikovia cinnamomea]|uniref:Anti-anti-sigma factor n=1 Tax=Krasilnikovia cinnamomea TaxID=349313 RepID=A0A4Q7ZIP1_9ACTN|nr:STAS domain-containing protein [Krasilnikovia cinnamomea]RZU50718.1 anti-anti-sigma factor [Krasilnikovia cinnamomea]
MTSPFGVRKHDDGDGVARLVVRGEIDSDVSAALTDAIAGTVGQPGVTTLVIDLRQVSLLAAAGVRSLLEGHVAASRHGCAYQVVNTHGIVERVLRVAGVMELLGVTSAPARAHR